MAQSISVRDQDTWSNLAPYVLSIVRIVVALLFFEHGLSKLFGFPQAAAYPALFSLSWFAAAIEFIGGALLAVGLFSRTAAFIMSGEMAFAYFISHAPHDFFPIINRGDAAILYCFIFLLLYLSLDRLRRRWAVEPRCDLGAPETQVGAKAGGIGDSSLKTRPNGLQAGRWALCTCVLNRDAEY